jgi:large subunit ribosomal protein L18
LTAGGSRAVVRCSGRRVRVALVTFDPVGDRVVAAADSSELARIAFPPASLASTPAAYLTGYLAGLRAKAAGTEGAVLDVGLRHPTTGGRLAAALKGLLDAGLEIPHGEGQFPAAERLNGAHLPHPLPAPVETFKQKLPGLVPRTEASA